LDRKSKESSSHDLAKRQ
jgi:hypothetical protein